MIKGTFEDGVQGEEALQPRERTGVGVPIPTQAQSDDNPTGWEAAQSLIGFIDGAPADMAEHHDHYVYGRARVTFVDTRFLVGAGLVENYREPVRSARLAQL